MKYKLIKEYPGSIKLGTIVYLETEDNYMTNMENDFRLFPKKIVENYPEFWEEVVEKDYEILSLARLCSIKPTITDVSDYGDGYIEALLKCDKSRIHSVKRNDGEIFTIGDKIFPNNKIYKFELKNDILKIWHCDISFSTPIIEGPSGQPGNCSWIEGINNIKKIKKPLFTTEDGVDIFEGDIYYRATDSSGNHFKLGTLTPIYTNGYEMYLQNYSKQEQLNHKHFSTKEKAEEYILYNKHCLSLNDIFKDVEEMRKGLKTFEDSELAKRFKKLVQQKLKS